MARKAKSSVQVQSDEYVVASSGGFPPNWTPEDDGESVDFIPIAIRAMKGSKKGKGMKQGYVIDGEYVTSQSTSFTQGSKKNKTEIEVSMGDTISINLNATLMGESQDDRKLAFIPTGAKGKRKTNIPQFTRMAEASRESRKPVRVIFHGSADIAGGRTVKRFEIRVHPSCLTS